MANLQPLWGLAAMYQSIKYRCLLQNVTALAKAKRIQVPNVRLMIKNETRGQLLTLPFQQTSLFIKSHRSVH